MVFKCQENSFLKEFTTKVISCEKSTFIIDAKTLNGYNVMLEDTILFPEGGGQPCDYGEINNKPVWNVLRQGDVAIHFVETDEPFEEKEQVQQKLNWKRRLDHMQQHSGQHLITAICDQEYDYDTKSWYLGNDISYIELDTKGKDIPKSNMEKIESMANDLIIEGRNVTVNNTTKEDFFKLPDIRSPRGLPADHVGNVRVITIDGIESNMCCGTHVTNLFQLQGIKLLNVEKSKNRVLLYFLAGQRIFRKLDDCYNREIQLTNIIKNGPHLHIDLVQKQQINFRNLQKSFQKILKELALFEAEKIIKKLSENSLDTPKYYSLHRKDGIEPDFINTFLRNAPNKVLYFLTVSDVMGKSGNMVLRGTNNQDEIIQKFGKEFMIILNGKGNGKGNQYQGKFNMVSKIGECDKILKEYFDTENT